MEDVVISGIQQMGIGVANMPEAWSWYRKVFGVDIKVFEEAAEAKLMLPYTGGEPRSRHAALAINLQGGGGFEIWQYTSRTPEPPTIPIELGDLGLFACKIKCKDASSTFQRFKEDGVKVLNEPTLDGRNTKHFFLQDPYGNVFDVIENDFWFKEEGKPTGATFGALVGVSDMERSKAFYAEILGYDKILFEGEGTFDDYSDLPGGDKRFQRVILTHKSEREGGFSRLFGPSEIELVKVMGHEPKKIFADRFWGDLGFIHLCFDIAGMDVLKEKCKAAGHPFTIDSFANLESSFDMGEAAGHFSYIEDPDGALIEFVETHKIPIIKRLGWYLDLRKKNPKKPLPNYILKAMAVNRVKS